MLGKPNSRLTDVCTAKGRMMVGMRKVVIAFLATMLFCFLLCGCNGPAGFQNVENIVSIDYSYNSYTSSNYYTFDLDRKVFCFSHSSTQENLLEYDLNQSEIEAIRNAFVPVEKWVSDYQYKSLGGSIKNDNWQYYDIVINYADGTSCVLKGTSSGEKMPKGFEELNSTLDGIVNSREYGSFTRDKTYSYDGKYYAVFNESFGSFEIDVYSSDGYVNAIMPQSYYDDFYEGDFWGVCWENDSYNLWIQTKDGGTMCFSKNGDEWTLNEDAVRPDYIICRSE